ncbi:MAG: MoxR family ATPase, partial [Alphaproteobacteria bacterium]|nr:MoxR family ATPase [Alphaproteobacteria bacterium]
FVVLATQNPIEQEGTYPLPEAQMDRFLMKMSMGYPDRAEEKAILARRKLRGKDQHDVEQVTSPKKVVAMQKALETVHVDPAILSYIVEIVQRHVKVVDAREINLGTVRFGYLRDKLRQFQVYRLFAKRGRIYENLHPGVPHRVLVAET